MPIATKCPGCGHVISAPDSAAGHKAKCPKCGSIIAILPDPAADLVAALASRAPAEETDSRSGSGVTPTPSRSGTPSPSRSGATTVSRMLARTSPYDSLRLLGAIIFGLGIALSVLALLAGIAVLVLASTGGEPLIGIGVFIGAVVLAGMLLLGARTLSELVRLWADVGDRARYVSQMLEESLNRSQEGGAT